MKNKRYLIAGALLGAASLNAQVDYTLQVIHASDLEGGVDAIGRAPNFAAITEYLEANTTADGTVILSAGDNYIPGPFFSASGDSSLRSTFQTTYQDLFSEAGLTNIREGGGRIDITIMNIVGFDASAIGNHEFDLGSDTFESIIEEDVRGNTLGDIRWLGAQFPYLSSNLDFSGDSDLSNLVTSDILANTDFALTPADATSGGNPFKIAAGTVIDAAGEPVGVIGATTQRLNQISSPSGTQVIGATDNDVSLLATQLQTVIDSVALGLDGIASTSDDINKIILVTHLQQIALEQALAAQLRGVDVIIAGGSDTLLADGDDVLRSGDTADASYPLIVNDLDSNPTLIVSTDGEYSYVGRLTVPFDASGVVLPAQMTTATNGPIATQDAQVTNLWGSLAAAFAPGTNGKAVEDLITPVETIVATQDGNVFGYTAVYLDGTRASVRTQETNMGNLTADANLAAAQAIDSTVVLAHKNGGGIRSAIGSIDGTTGELLPPEANPLAVPAKLEGGISELDISNVLRFNNELTLIDVSVADLLAILEYAFGASFEGATQGRYPQFAGLQVAYTPPVDNNSDGNIVVGDGDTEVVINSFALVNEDGRVTEVLYEDGAFVASPTRELRIVTLNFLAGGGDGYPFPSLGSNRLDTGVGEQAALQGYLTNNFPSPALAYSAEEVEPTQDSRIQNLDFRLESIGADYPVFPAGAVRLTPVATYETGVFDDSAAEIVAYDVNSQRLFAVSSAGAELLVLDASDPENSGITLVNTIAAPAANYNPNSVDTFSGVHGDVVAVCWADTTDAAVNGTIARGLVTLHNPATLAQIGSNITVGYHPDMLTFTPDGNKIVVANEGEPRFDDDDNITDNPEGSISIIDISAGYGSPTTTEVSFSRWNRRERVLRARGILLTQVDASLATNVAEDLEPEYVAVTADSRYAYVSLQENNAVALVDLRRNAIRNILPLGVVNHLQQPLDASDRDSASGDEEINIDAEPVFGLRQPDSIAVMQYQGQPYLFTANEGDARDFEEKRVKSGSLTFDPSGVISRLPNLQDDEELGRLEFNTAASDLDGDGDIDEIFAYGGRSMSVFRAPIVGRFRAVAGTGSDMDMYTASLFSTVFHSNNDDNDSLESRSDAKGAEPEALTLAEINGRTYAFIGLERQSAIMVYDVTNPTSPQFEAYASNRGYVDENNAIIDADTSAAGDLGPESIEFIAASDSPLGVPMIAVANEVSGTVTLWKIDIGL